MARYDFALTDDEFAELTPAEFNALGKRRNVRIRHERYANAITAASVYNVNRADADTPVVSAFDFVREADDSTKRERRLEAKRFVKNAIGGLPFGTPREKFLEVRLKVITDLQASGYNDAEQIVNECFPSLKPKENE